MTGESRPMARPVIFGEVLFDIFPGNRRVLGGAPFNVAWHLQGFGLSPRLISRIGNDAGGREIIKEMRNWGLDTALVQTDGMHATGEVRIDMANGGHTFDIVDQQAYDHIENVPEAALNDGDTFLYHGTLAARHRPTRQALNDLCRRDGTRIFLDINLRDPWWRRETVESMLTGTTWVKLNHHELLCLCDASPDIAEGDIETLSPLAADFLERHGIGELWLTCGGSGAAVFTREGERAWAPAQPVAEIKDTVGAGDGFTAIVILGIYRGWRAEHSLKRAQAFAAAICGMNGAIIPAPDMYQRFSQKWE